MAVVAANEPGVGASSAAAPVQEAVAAPAHESGGLPQLRYEYWPGQIVWLLIIFAVLYAVLSKALLPKVARTLEAREAKIAGDMAEARALRDQAEVESRAGEAEMADARARIARTAAESKARSAADAARRQAAMEAELGDRLAAAEVRIRASRDQAMGQVRAIAAETLGFITDKLTRQPATPAEIDAALQAVPGPGR